VTYPYIVCPHIEESGYMALPMFVGLSVVVLH